MKIIVSSSPSLGDVMLHTLYHQSLYLSCSDLVRYTKRDQSLPRHRLWPIHLVSLMHSIVKSLRLLMLLPVPRKGNSAPA